jgi:hypothetical protein
MQTRWRAALAAAALIAFTAPDLGAQIDYRNLDDDRPVRAEDAYPLERYAFDFLLPYSFERGRGGDWHQAVVPEIEYGLLRNFQLGLKLPVVVADTSGAAGAPTIRGISGLRLFALFNVNTEGSALPAFALRLDGYAPVGNLGGDGARGSVKVIATRSFGKSRVHLNGSYGFGDFAARALVEGGERWWYGAAVDRTLFRQSVLLVAEAFALRGSRGEATQVNASLGFRWQWTPMTVLDAGISRSLHSSRDPEIALTVGLSRAFAIGALMPRGRVPTPTPGGRDEPHHH